jgi:hypothetical protein
VVVDLVRATVERYRGEMVYPAVVQKVVGRIS